ncbi:MAG: helix-turn-helix domain-containing protein [Armatimonadota bacterium]
MLRIMAIISVAGALYSLTEAQAQVRPPEINLARADLAGRLGVTPESVSIERFEQRDWPNTSLGCPQAGMMYAQVVTPGYYILLRHGADVFEYHSDRNGRIAYCSRNIVSPHEVPAVVDVARRDLAQRMGCIPAEISVVETPYVEWAPEMLGVPYQYDALRLAEVQPGYRPVLECKGREFQYATDLERTVSLVREVLPGSVESYRLAYLAPASDPDGYNLWDLVVRDSATGEEHLLAKNVVDFAISPTTGRVLFLRRAAGQMVMGGLEGREIPLLSGPDFRGLSWDDAGLSYSVWTREREGGPWRLALGTVPYPPSINALSVNVAAPGLPEALQWQGKMAAYSFRDGDNWQSFLVDTSTGDARPLPAGRFAGWLDAPGEYLRIEGDQLIHDSTAQDYAFMVVANIPGLAWALPQPGCREYVALTQEGQALRMWTGPIEGQRAPLLTAELRGDLVKAQISPLGRVLLVQQIAPIGDTRQECQVALVSMASGEEEVLTGVCPRAQILAPLRGPEVTVSQGSMR